MGLNLYTSFANLAANGNTSSVPTAGEFNSVGAFLGTGVTFGSGTLKAQVSFDGGTTYLDVPSASFTSGTAAAKKADYTVIGPKMRFNLAGSTSPTLKLRTLARQVRKAAILSASFTADGTFTFVIPNQGITIAWAAWGTWGSGTLAFELSPDGGTTWFSIASSLTANGIKHIASTDNKETLARLSLTGSTSPSLSARIVL